MPFESNWLALPEVSASDRRKLHPAATAVWALGVLKGPGLAIVPLLLFEEAGLLVGLFVVLVVAGSFIRFASFRYSLHDQGLVVEGGLVSRWRRDLSKDRVQSVDVVRKLTHRLFGVAEVRVEVIGSTATEARLTAVSVEEAERIRAHLLGPPSSPGLEEEASPLVALAPRDLLVYGATGGRVAVIGAVLASVVELVPEERLDEVLGRLEPLGRAGVVAAVVAVAAFLIVAIAVSLALTVLVYWDFTVRLDEGRLALARGLTETRRVNVPLRRIQAIQLNENALRRLLGLASLSMVVAGYAPGTDETKETSVLLPIARRHRALEMIAIVLGTRPGGFPESLVRPPRRALVRRLAAPTALAGGATVWSLVAAFPVGAAVAAAALALVWPWTVASWRQAGYAVTGDLVVARSGWFLRTTVFVPIANVHRLRLVDGPVQRPLRLATVRLGIPHAQVRASDVDRTSGQAAFQRVGSSMTAR